MLFISTPSVQFSSVQSLSHVQFFSTPWTTARQASLSITDSWSLLKVMSIESVMPSNHLILCHPLLLLPIVFLNIRVSSSELAVCIRWPKYWSFRITCLILGILLTLLVSDFPLTLLLSLRSPLCSLLPLRKVDNSLLLQK